MSDDPANWKLHFPYFYADAMFAFCVSSSSNLRQAKRHFPFKPFYKCHTYNFTDIPIF